MPAACDCQLFTRVAAYLSQDGLIELDAVAEGPAPRLVEVKWRNRPVSRASLQPSSRKPTPWLNVSS